MTFHVGPLSHCELQDLLLRCFPDDCPVDNLVAHAKLWQFADMYIANELKELCLHKLHRDLKAFKLTADSARKLKELYDFVYQQIPYGGDEEPDSSPLRSLMAAYTQHNGKALLQREEIVKVLKKNSAEMIIDVVRQTARISI